MRRVWSLPGGEVSRLYLDMLRQVHLLIAGATGSGKSTVVNGIMCAALTYAPTQKRFILIDPKGCELDEYKHLPHCITYAHKSGEILAALRGAVDLVNIRFADMRRKGLRMYDGSDVYVIIDELVPLMTLAELKKPCIAAMQELLTVARAARVHCIACTQSPIAIIIPSFIRCNYDSRLGLRTATAQDSRNIIGRKGCEKFPAPAVAGIAYGYYMRGADLDLYKLPMVDDRERRRLLDWWEDHNKPRLKWA